MSREPLEGTVGASESVDPSALPTPRRVNSTTPRCSRFPIPHHTQSWKAKVAGDLFGVETCKIDQVVTFSCSFYSYSPAKKKGSCLPPSLGTGIPTKCRRKKLYKEWKLSWLLCLNRAAPMTSDWTTARILSKTMMKFKPSPSRHTYIPCVVTYNVANISAFYMAPIHTL